MSDLHSVRITKCLTESGSRISAKYVDHEGMCPLEEPTRF